MITTTSRTKMNRLNNETIFASIALSILIVASHWGLWDRGIYAFGWNTSLIWLGIILLIRGHNILAHYKQNWTWLSPIIIIILSFSLFENIWLKFISCLILPCVASLFFAYEKLLNKDDYIWDCRLIWTLIKRACSPIKGIFRTLAFLTTKITTTKRMSQNSVLKRTLIGLCILFPLASLAIFLLTSVDENFNIFINSLINTLLVSFSWNFFWKIIFIIASTVLLLSVKLSYGSPLSVKNTSSSLQIDQLITMIVISGLLGIYLLFLYMQVEYLVINSLPIDFDKAEFLVKSGFWQLFFLSIVNIVMFTFLYKKTKPAAQILLCVFIVASSFLLLSAAWRMSLYVYYYGLSYEKFFASYTCVFAIGMFGYLVFVSLIKKHQNILKVITFTALWAYSIATITPIEKIIFNANTYLSKNSDTRIELNHLRFLSLDILNNIETQLLPSLRVSKELAGFDNSRKGQNRIDWQQWIKTQKNRKCHRPWYEKTISLMINCS
jgi:hypothetical protein